MKKTKTKSVLSYFWKYKKSIVLYFAIFAAVSVLTLFISIETASFLDNLSANENQKAMYSLIAITAITLVSQAMYYVVQIIYLKVSNKIALNIKKDLAHRVLSISSATLDHTASGTIINRIDNDPEHLINASVSEFEAKRFAPCRPVHELSPKTYRRRIELSPL